MNKNFLVMQFSVQQHFARPRLQYFLAKHLGPDSFRVLQDNFICTRVFAKKFSTNVLHTCAHHPWKFEVALIKPVGVPCIGIRTTPARRLQNCVLFSRVEQLLMYCIVTFWKQFFCNKNIQERSSSAVVPNPNVCRRGVFVGSRTAASIVSEVSNC